MKEVISLLLITGISFLVFLVFLLIGIIKKNLRLVLISVLIFVISSVVGVWSIIVVTKKAYDRFSELAEPRSGFIIYTSLFGQPHSDCLEMINYKDQLIPKIDVAIWLHFKTCPEELGRIVRRKEFKMEKIAAANLHFEQQPSANENWFDPKKLGDTVLIFTWYDERNNGQEIYCSTDSTEVYLKDIFD